MEKLSKFQITEDFAIELSIFEPETNPKPFQVCFIHDHGEINVPFIEHFATRIEAEKRFQVFVETFAAGITAVVRNTD